MNPKKRSYVFDFDSTLTSVEALDVLAEITLADNPKKNEIIQKIIDITNLGIDGEISFTESLERRIKLLNAKKTDLPLLIKELRQKVSPSIGRNKEFFEQFQQLPSWFTNLWILVVASIYGIKGTQIFKNNKK